ncbi:hydrolase 3-like [Pyrus x bretschneideri]|uniref:hydrolase 3-like n=1 Tax=Pyrus x bretschneideri TaxID=225117 RepID=UPI00202E08BF|nr:hydrolase 3-like [Pyrus x bretschneideri]
MGSPYVLPFPRDPEINVSDITISQNPSISSRLYLPPQNQKYQQPKNPIPVLVYLHGGGFCFESAFSSDYYRFLNRLVSQAQVLTVSAEYRLVPENPFPMCYLHCWDRCFSMDSSHKPHKESDASNADKEPWLVLSGSFDKLYIGRDSAGGNSVHNVAIVKLYQMIKHIL